MISGYLNVGPSDFEKRKAFMNLVLASQFLLSTILCLQWYLWHGSVHLLCFHLHCELAVAWGYSTWDKGGEFCGQYLFSLLVILWQEGNSIFFKMGMRVEVFSLHVEL